MTEFDLARMHIEVVTDTYSPDVNGVARTLRNLCEGMRGHGHRVEVIRSGKAHGPHETGVPGWSVPWYREVRMGWPRYRWFLRRWSAAAPDAIYVSVETALGYSAAAAARKLGIPVVAGFHTNFREYFHNYGFGWLGDFLFRYQRWFHGRTAMTLVPSPVSRQKLLREGFQRVEILGRGVDAELFSPLKRDDSLRASWGAGPDAPVILVGGRISSEKNIGLAIRAFRRIKELRPDAVCVLVGDGPARAKLEHDNPDVVFTGYHAGEELAHHYASTDILLFPSETETFGNVLLEAMACGLAILAYDDAAAAWHGVDGKNLLKVPKGDEAAFLEAAVRLPDPVLRRHLADNAVRTAGGLSWESVVGQWEHFLGLAAKKRFLPPRPEVAG
ncbi:MAG: glycosyltransferase family 1 protein [Verrucomicrobiota bacterium]